METKLSLLEQRINLVEQFVETRFCESYRDFLIRRGAGKNDSLKLLAAFTGQRFCESFRDFTVRLLSSQTFTGGEGRKGESTPISQFKKPCTTSIPEELSPPKSRPTTRSTTTSAKRELIIRVVRLEDTQIAPASSLATPSKKIDRISRNHDNPSPESPPPPPTPTDIDTDTQTQDKNLEEIGKEDGGDGNEDEDTSQDDSYFTFPFEEFKEDDNHDGGGSGEVDDDDPLGAGANDPDDRNWSGISSDDSEFENPRPSSSSKTKATTVVTKRKYNKDRERPFKCGYPPCEKSFMKKHNLDEHELRHRKDKWLKCRVKDCNKMCVTNSQRLKHERKCIEKSLKADKHVDKKVIEDVRRRTYKFNKRDPFEGMKGMEDLEFEEDRVDEEGRPVKKKRKKEPNYRYEAEEMEGTILNEETKCCPICGKHWRVDRFEGHLRSHVKERTLRCGGCGRGVLDRQAKNSCERRHEKEKYRFRCRVGGGGDGEEEEEWCGKRFVNKSLLTIHERRCVRRALEEGREVGKEVMEDVRGRSEGVILNWRGWDLGEEEVGRVKVCYVCKRWRGEGNEYEEHMEGHRKWGCGKCGRKFVLKRELVRHVYRKHREKKKGEGEEDGGGEGEEETDNSEVPGHGQEQQMGSGGENAESADDVGDQLVNDDNDNSEK